jgi:hypothetical protein
MSVSAADVHRIADDSGGRDDVAVREETPLEPGKRGPTATVGACVATAPMKRGGRRGLRDDIASNRNEGNDERATGEAHESSDSVVKGRRLQLYNANWQRLAYRRLLLRGSSARSQPLADA